MPLGVAISCYGEKIRKVGRGIRIPIPHGVAIPRYEEKTTVIASIRHVMPHAWQSPATKKKGANQREIATPLFHNGSQ